MRRALQAAACALLAVVLAAGVSRAAEEDAGSYSSGGTTTMADDEEIAAAETAVKQAEQDLQDYLGGTVTRGIVLNEERGKKLRELRASVDAAKKRLDDAKNQ